MARLAVRNKCPGQLAGSLGAVSGGGRRLDAFGLAVQFSDDGRQCLWIRPVVEKAQSLVQCLLVQAAI